MKTKRIAAALILSMLLCGCGNSDNEPSKTVSTPSAESVISSAESSKEEIPSVVESVVSEAESSAEESPAVESIVSEAESSTEESTVSEPESSAEESKSKPRGNYTFEDGVLTIYSDQFFEKAYKMFAEYSQDSFKLKNIVIEDGVTKIGEYAFKGCTKLESVVMSDSVTEIDDYAFAGCYSLNNMEISKSLTKIGKRAFEKTAVEEITLPDGLAEIGEAAFAHCSTKTIVIPYSVTIMGYGVVGFWGMKQTVIIEGRSEAPDTWETTWNNSCDADIVWDA